MFCGPLHIRLDQSKTHRNGSMRLGKITDLPFRYAYGNPNIVMSLDVKRNASNNVDILSVKALRRLKKLYIIEGLEEYLLHGAIPKAQVLRYNDH